MSKYVIMKNGTAVSITDDLYDESDISERTDAQGGFNGNAPDNAPLPPGSWRTPVTKRVKSGFGKSKARR